MHCIKIANYQEAPNFTKVKYGDHYECGFINRKKLKANIEYTTPHGHVYRTDHKGRIKEVYADDLSLLDDGRNLYAQRTVGREDRLPDDDGGHLIAHTFGGSKDIDNLVPKVNTSIVHLKRMVNGISWRKNGNQQKKRVKLLKIELKYTSDKMRPSVFRVQYERDGVTVREFIDNI
ncbi:DNA/RNA non-specific endonuclease [Staphylococcus epidermidis]|uniref:DNA/RNA non-specific endonuclease n=1 Tax=Staphylococcus epidermidis TaxID=1282 RepID=UPI0018873D59|nr:DNA/RNA non-specific endonuclease [Staphylococcus epidermidis]MBF2141451.1 DNA/RNA non-specific endonuclease [Staphylococcus epidermidis]MBF2296233.1 DNA/RNA non-specific endonuclease [Staphylococcus epidermidis]MBF2305416.1 DNA/RNA non-specific endonuclease [Staphylococcus epidermidis]MBF2314560.1 DNA/RNA non-specific endonuclease [Staphylococcus epidermidis]MCG1791886.1 DNA/RNA non-specific endonuclease [Staphylococcus epidermidis]